MPEWWTNRSLPWSSGVMKPKPLSSLNHFTVPCGMAVFPPLVLSYAEVRCERNDCERWHKGDHATVAGSEAHTGLRSGGGRVARGQRCPPEVHATTRPRAHRRR